METLTVKAQGREQTRTRGAEAVRKAGLIPAVVYGSKESKPISVKLLDIRDAIYTPEFKIVELDVDGDKRSTVVRDVQFHPVTEEIVHIDFLELVPENKVVVEVPVRFEGTAPGLKMGGKLMRKMRKVKIKTTPENLVDELIFDVSELKLGQSVRVRDAQVGEEIEVLNSPSIPVASIEIPRALKGAEAGEEEEGEEGEETPEGEGGETTEEATQE